MDDITYRAVKILKEVLLIAVEDKRHSSRLLQKFDIKTSLLAYHDHNEQVQKDKIIGVLASGKDVALISDAGTPLISDPGYHLIKAIHYLGFKVVPVPGACALIAGLSVAGLPSDRFVFEGFLPAKSSGRIVRLQSVREETGTLIFYEAPHRLLNCLNDMRDVLGADRTVVLARELTKTFETIKKMLLGDMCSWVCSDLNQQRGECVLLVSGCVVSSDDPLSLESLRILKLLLDEVPLKRAVALTSEITGQRKNLLYQAALKWRE
ncbi:UNVERIFIED_CONTAM: hypothetical protein GTU68_056373 [Idotea baltica]|nr:hypothetical protein [Idotea baltica]